MFMILFFYSPPREPVMCSLESLAVVKKYFDEIAELLFQSKLNIDNLIV
jgi:hypothetical protein